MNINPTLIMGLALAYAERVSVERGTPLRQPDHIEVRIYPDHGSGYWFVRGYAAGRWYWQAEAGADHFTRADLGGLEAAIESVARVQVCGARGESYGVWKTWPEFCAAVGG